MTLLLDGRRPAFVRAPLTPEGRISWQYAWNLPA
jgi:hypothetical protein